VYYWPSAGANDSGATIFGELRFPDFACDLSYVSIDVTILLFGFWLMRRHPVDASSTRWWHFSALEIARFVQPCRWSESGMQQCSYDLQQRAQRHA
jgi:hypothetical protein